MNQRLRSSIESGIARIGTRLVLVMALGATIACDRVTKQVAATKLTAAQRKATDAWAAQLERDRETARKAAAKAERELALQKAQLEKSPSKKGRRR